MQIGVQTWKVAGCCLGSTGGRAGDHDLLRFRLLSREGDRYRALRRSRERDRDLEGERDLLISHCPLSALSAPPQSFWQVCFWKSFLENLWPAHARKVSESKPWQPGSIWTKSGSQAQSGFNEKPQNFGITPENGMKQRFCGFVVLQTLWPETMTKIPHHCTPQMIERFASIRTRRNSVFPEFSIGTTPIGAVESVAARQTSSSGLSWS